MKFEQIPREDAGGAAERQDAFSEQLRFWRRSIAKHKVAIVLLTALVGAVAALLVSSLTPVYRATATLFIEPGKTKIVSIEEVYSGISANREHIQTQAEIMKSHELTAKLVRRMKLASHPALDPRQKPPSSTAGFNWKEYVPAGWIPEEPPISEEAATHAAIEAVASGLEVQLVRNSQLIRLSFESPDRVFAATAANSFADLYIENDLEARMQMTQKAAAWLTERLKSLRGNLEAAERALQEFRDRERIVDSKGVALGASRQMEDMTSSLVAARQKVVELENSYNQVQAVLKGRSRAKLDSVPAVLRNATVVRVKELENEASRRVTELSGRYGAEHPRIIAAQTDLHTARENTRRAVDTVVASITREYEVAKATERTLTETLNQSKTEILDINRKEFQLASLEREVQTNRQLYDMFFSRFKETSAIDHLQSTIARVIDPAVVPSVPVRPQKTRIILTALAFGLFLGVVLAFLLEYLDNTVRTSNEVESKLGAPLLGILPWIENKDAKFELQRAFFEDMPPTFVEAVRTLRTSVLMSALDSANKTILVTSSVPEEGKTSVAINLALALAQLKRTCLIDADMRRPQIARILEVDPDAPGLSQLMAGTEPAQKCIHRFRDSGLHFIPSGPVPSNPLELLSSRRFGEMLRKLEESFDVLVLDSPPVQLVSDAVVLAGIANSLVFVVRADTTPHQVARGAMDILKKGKTRLLGVVLNQLDWDKAERYYGYGKFSYGGKYKSYKSYGYSRGDAGK
jgi:capsular exopolysaccharide synthesis family protein